MLYRLLQFFEEKNGILSSNRLVFVLWLMGMLIVWGFVSIKELKMAEIPESNIIVIALLLTGKVLQKGAELKDSKDIIKKRIK